MSLPAALLVVGVTVVAMELFAYAMHRWVMHGRIGWNWHRSHHEKTARRFEKNDLFALVFAGMAIAFFLAGTLWSAWLWWIGVGMTSYGLLYFIFHDGLVHKRWPFRFVPKRGYLRRLYQAHRLHHARDSREGCVSFGFLYAAPVPRLKAQLNDKAAAGSGAAGQRADADASS